MSRERIISAFILKRQDYAEADQIITLFSKEEGKIRVLVKAAKLPTSKLQPLLQPLFETRISLSGSNSGAGLAKVIGAQLISAYSGILESEAKLAAWYMASELVIRSLPDSAPNETLYEELQKFAMFLHKTELSTDQIKHSITQFQIKSLSSLGLGIKTIPNSESQMWFSLSNGGFVSADSADATPILGVIHNAFLDLVNNDYSVAEQEQVEIATPLYNLVNRFVTYQLEREIKSQRLFANT